MARDYGAFDLFAGLSALGSKKYDWFDSLSPEGRKAAAPYVMMRWMTGTSDQAQIVRLNLCVNMHIFACGEKQDHFRLLAAAATGKSKRFNWIKGPAAVRAKTMSLECIKQYYECSTREADTYKVSADDLIEMAEELGWDKEEIAKLRKEQDDGSGATAKASVKPKKLARR